MNKSTQEQIKTAVKFIYKLWKPDFLKSAGMVLISAGLLRTSGSMLETIVQIYFNITVFTDVPGFMHYETGVFLIAIGINFLLIVEARSCKRMFDARLLAWLAYIGTAVFAVFAIRLS